MEIFGGVTALGVGGVPPRGALDVAEVGAAEAGVAEEVCAAAVVAPACGLFWKYVTHSLGIEDGSD